MERPIIRYRNNGLWYSPHEQIYYWQSNDGAGELFSQSFDTQSDAELAARQGQLIMRRVPLGG